MLIFVAKKAEIIFLKIWHFLRIARLHTGLLFLGVFLNTPDKNLSIFKTSSTIKLGIFQASILNNVHDMSQINKVKFPRETSVLESPKQTPTV